jgi:hypothetical protein
MTRKVFADPSLAEFFAHSKAMRKLGCTKVRIATKTVELEAEFGAEQPEIEQQQPAIGFVVPVQEEWEEE